MAGQWQVLTADQWRRLELAARHAVVRAARGQVADADPVAAGIDGLLGFLSAAAAPGGSARGRTLRIDPSLARSEAGRLAGQAALAASLPGAGAAAQAARSAVQAAVAAGNTAAGAAAERNGTAAEVVAGGAAVAALAVGAATLLTGPVGFLAVAVGSRIPAVREGIGAAVGGAMSAARWAVTPGDGDVKALASGQATGRAAADQMINAVLALIEREIAGTLWG